jgi:hypothetical protein
MSVAFPLQNERRKRRIIEDDFDAFAGRSPDAKVRASSGDLRADAASSPLHLKPALLSAGSEVTLLRFRSGNEFIASTLSDVQKKSRS